MILGIRKFIAASLLLATTLVNAEVIYSYTGAAPMAEVISCTVLAPDQGDGVWQEGSTTEEGEWRQTWDQECAWESSDRPTHGALSASFSVGNVLAANLNAVLIDSLSWSIGNGAQTITNQTAGFSFGCAFSQGDVADNCIGGPAGIYVSTDSEGNITEWMFSITADSPEIFQPDDAILFSTSNPITRELFGFDGTPIGTIVLGGDEASFYLKPALPGGSLCGPGCMVDDYGQIIYGPQTYEAVQTTAGAWTATVVPVPAAVWLFASGLGLLGWLRRR